MVSSLAPSCIPQDVEDRRKEAYKQTQGKQAATAKRANDNVSLQHMILSKSSNYFWNQIG